MNLPVPEKADVVRGCGPGDWVWSEGRPGRNPGRRGRGCGKRRAPQSTSQASETLPVPGPALPRPLPLSLFSPEPRSGSRAGAAMPPGRDTQVLWTPGRQVPGCVPVLLQGDHRLQDVRYGP